jgi:hypothetical protein
VGVATLSVDLVGVPSRKVGVVPLSLSSLRLVGVPSRLVGVASRKEGVVSREDSCPGRVRNTDSSSWSSMCDAQSST